MSHTKMGGDPDFPSAADNMDTHLFECDTDGCAASVEGQGEFTEVWSEAKRDGWRCYQQGGQWKHRCPEHARVW